MGSCMNREDPDSDRTDRKKDQESGMQARKHEENKDHDKEGNPAQAGGHEGSLITRGDKLYKRALPGEVKFYEEVFDPSNTDENLIELRKFLPQFFGIEKIDGKDYLILENLLLGYENPSIMDCKIGKITWTKDHNEKKVANQMKKAEKT